MIYVTGDTHGEFNRFTTYKFPEGKGMTKNDYMVILGDFGGIWNEDVENGSEKFFLNWLDEKPYTVLFIDGNHENFDRLLKYPEKQWHGGIVNEIRPSVLHLKRGYVFDIDGCKCFTFGGAKSHDIQDGILEPDDERIYKWRKTCRMFRINHISWWKEEEPSEEEMELGLKTLEENNWNVDFVFTHECPTIDLFQLYHFLDKSGLPVESYELTNYLEEIKVKLNYKKWFFGHHHDNRVIDGKDILMYERIERIH